MDFRELDRDSGQPVYRQIAAQIRAAVDAGELAPGARLPAIRELARSLGVNRDTVATAYETLVAEAVVESGVGRGTFVRRETPVPGPTRFRAPLSAVVERLIAEGVRRGLPAAEGAVPLQAVIPDPSLYPVSEFRRALARVLSEQGADVLGYGGPHGHPGLRRVLAERLPRFGVRRDPDEIVLCQGASQGISLALRLYTEPGDGVVVEEPTYANALATIAGLGLRAIPVPMRGDGLDLGELDRVLARPEARVLYTIPTFHNPTGITTSHEHRRGLLALARRHGTPLIEDAFEMDLHAGPHPIPPLTALDESGQTLLLSSFSKALFPGVRVGWIAARGHAVDGLLALRQAMDLGGAVMLQAAVAAFVESGAYERHLVKLRRNLKGRRDALLAALERELPPGARWTSPAGGYQVWLELPEGIDSQELLEDAVREGVIYAPGHVFTPDGSPSSTLRLSIASVDERAIERGVAALGRALRSRLAEGPGAVRRTAVHV